MGQELSGLGLKELQNLENQLEMSIHAVRTKKDNRLINEIQELNREVEETPAYLFSNVKNFHSSLIKWLLKQPLPAQPSFTYNTQ